MASVTSRGVIEKLGFASGVQIVKPLTDGEPDWLYSKGEGDAKRSVQNMCRYTPAVYSGFPFERTTKIPLSEAPFTAAFSRAYDELGVGRGMMGGLPI